MHKPQTRSLSGLTCCVQGDVVAVKTPCSFVDHIWEVFGPLLAGCSSVLLPKVLLLQPDALAAALVKHKVTHYVSLQHLY